MNLKKIASMHDVKRLCNLMTKNKHWEVRNAATKALKAIKDPAAVPALVHALGDIFLPAEFRETAAEALGAINDPAAVSAFIAALGHGDADVQVATLKALGANNDPAAVSAILTALGSTKCSIQNDAVKALWTINDPAAATAIVTALGDSSKSVRIGAIEALWAIKGRAAVTYFVTALEDSEATVRAAAAKALGIIQNSEAIPALAAALGDPEATVRAAAAWALGFIHNSEAIPALATALGDPDWGVRANAAQALGVFENSGALPALTAALEDSEVIVRAEAAKALGIIQNSEAIPALAAALGDPDEDVQRSAVEALRTLKWEPQSDSERVAWYAAANLDTDRATDLSIEKIGSIRDLAAIPALVVALGNHWPHVHNAAAKALVAIGEPVVPALMAALGESSTSLRISAIMVLGAIKAREAIHDLVAALEDGDKDVRASAVEALVAIEGREAVPDLVAVLEDSETDVRNKAARVLAALDDLRAAGPLCRFLDEHREESIWNQFFLVVQKWITNNVTEIEIEDLVILTALQNFSYTTEHDGTTFHEEREFDNGWYDVKVYDQVTEHHTIDTSKLVQIAKIELWRRKVDAHLMEHVKNALDSKDFPDARAALAQARQIYIPSDLPAEDVVSYQAEFDAWDAKITDAEFHLSLEAFDACLADNDFDGARKALDQAKQINPEAIYDFSKKHDEIQIREYFFPNAYKYRVALSEVTQDTGLDKDVVIDIVRRIIESGSIMALGPPILDGSPRVVIAYFLNYDEKEDANAISFTQEVGIEKIFEEPLKPDGKKLESLDSTP